jgi:hypothetical protein
MAYDPKKLYQQAIEAVEKNKLFFIEDLVAYLPCSKPTFYDHFKPDSNEFNNIKALLEENIIKAKQGLKAKWYKSDNPSMSLALYKLIGTDQERQKLAQSYQDVKIEGKVDSDIKITAEDVKKIVDNL